MNPTIIFMSKPPQEKKNIVVIPYDSFMGGGYLQNAKADGLYLEFMDQAHEFQNHITVCGLMSLIIAVNGKKLANGAKNKYLLTEKWIIDNYSTFAKKTPLKVVLSIGLTLTLSSVVAKEFGCKNITTIHCDARTNDKIQACEKLFRQTCKTILSQSSENKNKSFIVCNFHCAHFNKDCGHVSPIGGYDAKNDCVLILDTWKPYGKYWIKLTALCKLMNTIDNDSKKYRGYYYGDLPAMVTAKL